RQRGDRHLDVTETIQRLGAVLTARGQLDEAEALLTEAEKRYRSLPGHPVEGLVGCLGNVARVHWLRGDRKRAPAIPAQRRAMAQSALPPQHFLISVKMTNLASMAADDGDDQRAIDLLQQALQRSVAGGRAGEAAVQRDRLAALLRKVGRVEEADTVAP